MAADQVCIDLLPNGTTDLELFERFHWFVPVRGVRVFKNYRARSESTFGFLWLASVEAANQLKALRSLNFHGKLIAIKPATQCAPPHKFVTAEDLIKKLPTRPTAPASPSIVRPRAEPAGTFGQMAAYAPPPPQTTLHHDNVSGAPPAYEEVPGVRTLTNAMSAFPTNRFGDTAADGREVGTLSSQFAHLTVSTSGSTIAPGQEDGRPAQSTSDVQSSANTQQSPPPAAGRSPPFVRRSPVVLGSIWSEGEITPTAAAPKTTTRVQVPALRQAINVHLGIRRQRTECTNELIKWRRSAAGKNAAATEESPNRDAHYAVQSPASPTSLPSQNQSNRQPAGRVSSPDWNRPEPTPSAPPRRLDSQPDLGSISSVAELYWGIFDLVCRTGSIHIRDLYTTFKANFGVDINPYEMFGMTWGEVCSLGFSDDLYLDDNGLIYT